jgi:hypothetical protein
MKPKLTKSYDDLIASYYGSAENRFNDASTVEELFAGYYGKPDIRHQIRAKRPPSVVMTLSCDDGETLVQRRHLRPPNEYARQPRPVLSRQTSHSGYAELLARPEVSPSKEIEVDFAPVPPEPMPMPVPPPPLPPLNPGPVEPPLPQPSPTPMPVPPPKLPDGKPGSSEDEFEADLQAILRGQKVFDPVSGKTVDKSRVQDQRAAQQAPPPPPPPNESQAIFDRIAQSMQYANTFDLGTVELENRFADFDRMADLQKRADEKKLAKNRAAAPAPPVRTPAKPDSKDFLEDLDAIRHQQAAPPGDLAEAYSFPGNLSEALYDTGEHVLAAETLYPDAFLVGKAPGVKFGYGQIIAMADMFESVNQMMRAEPAELKKIKALIERSTAYYKANKAAPHRDVTTEDWQKAIGSRYLKLAEDNYDHFAPNLLFKGASFVKTPSRYGNHKAAWERHHEWAIKEAQKMFLDPRYAGTSYFPEWPLLINAFGDHFLTDAFAAGHVINKEAVIDYFKSNFYTQGKLIDKGKAFFSKVAEKAFTGDVAAKFKKLETAQPYDAWWNVVGWNPDIKNAERFGLVLIGAAEQEPDKIGNMAVKAIHDKLNRDGIEVTNGAGSGTWRLTGDGHLTTQTLTIMRQAVQQSADNITDPSIFGSNITIGNYFAKAWKYVPQLTSASETQVREMVKNYVNPDSSQLVDAAAAIIKAEVDSLIAVLIEKKALQPA